MYKPTTRQRLSVIFGTYVFIFILIIAAAVYYFFQAVLTSEIKTQSVHLANEVIRNFITIESGKISLIQKEKSTLEEELAETNSSAIIFDTSLDVLFGQGNFSFFRDSDSRSAKTIITIAKQTNTVKKLVSATIIWRDQHMLISAVPILQNNKFYGTLIIGKPITSFVLLNNSIIFAFAVLAIFSFAGSILLGNIIVRNALWPLKNLSDTINAIDLEKLIPATPVQGSPHDEIVQLVQKFNAMVHRINGMAQQQKEFITNASHELKTPITKATSSLELLSQDTAPPLSDDILKVRNTLFSMNTLLDQLMILSKLQSGTVPPARDVKLSSILTSVIKSLHQDITDKKLNINNNVNIQDTIRLSPEYASILFSNILTNAIKYSIPDTVIDISGTTNGKTQRICVSDHGLGMTESEVSHVFDKFYRSGDARRIAKGSGIGLSIVKRICEIYNIEIRIQSVKQLGTEVSLVFS